MPVTVVLAVGLDSWQLTAQSPVLRSAGYVFISVMSIRDAIEHFRAGDFDLVLLGHSIPMAEKEKLTRLIRAAGSRTPVVCIAQSPGDSIRFADATLEGEAGALLGGMRAAMAKADKAWAVSPRTVDPAGNYAPAPQRDSRIVPAMPKMQPASVSEVGTHSLGSAAVWEIWHSGPRGFAVK